MIDSDDNVEASFQKCMRFEGPMLLVFDHMLVRVLTVAFLQIQYLNDSFFPSFLNVHSLCTKKVEFQLQMLEVGSLHE